MDNNYVDNARIFKAFCDENRLQILEMLRSGEKCACKLLESLQIGQSTLSHHMKILCESGIVLSRSEGKWTYYFISESGSRSAKELLDALTTIGYDKFSCIKQDRKQD
ncbi:MAG: ArsR/SmtB family transcription factor [Saccharofermentanales bacterium]